jgi:cobalt-zinc-cadmium efflux system membrane fusion protein
MKPIESKKRRALYGGVAAALLLLSACSPADEPPAPEPAPQAEAAGATCSAHGAPADLCFICDASLRESGRLWCREHDRYEDRCFLCHPELQDKDRLWCSEHSLYEDECFLCHPELLEDRDAGAAETSSSVLWCNEHGVAEHECGICHPELLAQGAAGQGLKVRLGSAAAAGEAGVVVETPELREMQDGVACFAELTFNQNRLARITSLVAGVVKSVEVDLGSRVARGDALATITSAAIGEAQAAYLRAVAEEELRRKAFERERGLLAERISSEKEYQEAEAEHQAAVAAVRQARQRLLALGFTESRVDVLADRQSTPGVLELRAPFGGEIVERAAVQGAAVDAADVLFTVADTRVLWAMVNIPESDLPRVRTGQEVELTVESLPGQRFSGTLTWISATVDRRTRMVQGRVEVDNRAGRLKARMFARARIETARSAQSVVVPVSAVQDVTGTPVVFVRSAADLFEARPVTLGARRDGRVEIAAGLGPDEPVVVAGGFALKSQLLASRLGAGCVDE